MKISKALLIAGVCLIVVDKGLFAYADLINDTRITKNAKLYPLYQPLTIKRFASKVLGIQVNRELNFRVSTNTMIKYPKKDLEFNPALDKKYNIIIIAIEGLRFDMLNQETMPNVLAFGKENLVFNNHYSGGNGSRFGIFSLLYGVQGTYWHNFLAQRVSPVLIDTLIEKGYDFKILSSTRLTFPEFRKTAFIKIPEYIEDDFPVYGEYDRDEVMTDKAIDFISSRKAETPFFAFLFYNASHQPYHYPEEFEKFKPVSDKEINYFKGTNKKDIYMLRNRYKNAIYYNDYLIGKIITSLKDTDLFNKTIIFITGDHGEEFYENGYFGHTSSFDDYQIKTVFVMHFPNTKARYINRLTSHLDLVPTLMESLGCISPRGYYSHGVSLVGEQEHRFITAANWDNAAVIDDEFRIIYSTELYNIGNFEIRKKKGYAMVEDVRGTLKRRKNLLSDIALKMSEFYQ